MENEGQKSNENDESIQNTMTENHTDIEFEEVLSIDIDEIQNKLKTELGENEENVSKPIEEALMEDENMPIFEEIDKHLESAISQFPVVNQTEPAEHDESIKKYVVYVEADNVDYMENLSVNERKIVINDILREQNYLTKQERAMLRKKQFFSHLVLAIITFVVFFPLLFILVNKAAKITMENYSTAKSNFTKLYKEHGRIKSKK